MKDHPMQLWAAEAGMSVRAVARAAGCSEAHLSNLFAGRREASLRLAKKLSDLSMGAVPVEAFLTPRAEPSHDRAGL